MEMIQITVMGIILLFQYDYYTYYVKIFERT